MGGCSAARMGVPGGCSQDQQGRQCLLNTRCWRRTGTARGWSETRGLLERPRAAQGAGPIPSNPRAGSRLELARAQGCEDLQLAANILMVG